MAKKDFTGALRLEDMLTPANVEAPAQRLTDQAEAPGTAAKAESASGSGERKQHNARNTGTSERRGRPATMEANGEIRATFIVEADALAKLHIIALKQSAETGERVFIKDVVCEALRDYIRKYEKRNGSV